MKKKRGMAVAAALTLSMAMSVSALAASPSDISGHWAKGTITQWTSKGYISGYPDGTFKPDNSITRAEFVVLVNKAMGYTKKGNAYFRDVNTNYWGYDEIQKGVSAGYVKGDPDGSFRPNDSVTRQEAAVMISKILELETNFTSAAAYNDYRYIPSWSVGYVGAVSKAKIMAGYPDGSFKADRVLSRAEAVIALDKALNYDGKTTDKDEEKETKEDYTLEKTSLKDMTIKGDLIISSSLKSKAVSLDNVTVKGTLIVKGGGTITADDCDIKNLEMNYSDTTFKTKGDTEVKNTTFLKVGKLEGKGYDSVTVDKEFSDKITIDASINEFTLDAETDLRLLSSTVIKSFTATKNADRATINFSSADVKDMDIYDKIKITGKGDIDTMTVYVSGVTSSIKPDDLNRKNGADKPDYTSSSSSSGSSSSSRYDDLTITKDDKKINGGKYDDVTIKADDVKLDGTTIYGDLTIDKSVGNSNVYLDDVTVKGDVKVYGGGKNSVEFDDCDISGDIIADKNSSTPVNLEFKNNTDVDGTIRVRNNTIINSTYKLNKIILEDTDANLTLKANAYTVNFDKKGKLEIYGHTVDSITIGSSAKDSTIKLSGSSPVIKSLTAKSKVEVNGTGKVESTSGSGNIDMSSGIQTGVSVTGVSLDKKTANLTIGSTLTLKATVTPSNATNKKVVWSSSDATIASVDANGVVTPHKEGNADITVKTEDGNKTDKCTVTVTEKQIPATEISINKTTLDLTVGGNETLTATVTPSNSTDTVAWSSDKTNIATVDGNGKVTAVAAGEATITAKAGSKTATCTVTVKAETVKVESITITGKDGVNSIEAEGTLQLTATVTPDGATNKVVKWSSGNTAIATVDETSGLVTGVAKGSATITATAQDGNGVTGTFKVTVTEKQIPITSVTIEATGSGVIEVGETVTLTAKISPDNTTADKTVEWSITDGNNFVTISNSNGSCTVTGKAKGEAKITAKVGGVTSDAYTVTVNEKVIPIESVTVLPTTETIEAGKTTTLNATVNPSNTTESKAVTWTSSDPEVATVSNGTVTGKKAGTATITAKAGDKTATCEVTVKAATIAVTGVTLSSTTLDLTVGGATGSLTATVNPDNATNSNVTWTSDKTAVATVVDGTVTAVSAGTAKITVTTAYGNKTAECTVTVKPSITIAGGDSITVGATSNLTATVNGGTGASIGNYTWSIAAKDGGTAPTISNTNTSSATVTTTAQTTPGTYTVTLKVMINSTEYTVTKDITVAAAQTQTA